MGSIIQLDRLRKTFPGGVVAVDDVSLDIEEGEYVTLLGPSGCGKTTVLRTVAGFESPDSGSIRLAGQDVTDLPPYRRQVNMVFQDYALFPHMTVSQNVGYGLRIAGMPKAEIADKVRKALDLVEMSDKGDRQPHELSGGERQRVALTRAIIREPQVLLLDEPLSALDANLREAMRVELRHLHQRLGLTFVMVTHDQTEALVMSDRVVVMERGKVAQSGTPSDLYDHPSSTYVASFIGTSNVLRGHVAGSDAKDMTINYGSDHLKAVRNGAAYADGDAICMTIRPEKARLLSGKKTEANTNLLKGTVGETLFHGNSARVTVDLASGDTFMVDLMLPNTAAQSELPERGSAVTIAVDPANVNTFADEASA